MIGIIGFGRFGRFMAKHLMEDFKVRIYDEIDSADSIRSAGSASAKSLPRSGSAVKRYFFHRMSFRKWSGYATVSASWRRGA